MPRKSKSPILSRLMGESLGDLVHGEMIVGVIETMHPVPPFIPRLYTDWEGFRRPSARGVYAVRQPRPGFARWDGAVWYGVENTVESATYNMNISDVQQREWRGLTEEAYNMMKGDPMVPFHDDDVGYYNIGCANPQQIPKGIF